MSKAKASTKSITIEELMQGSVAADQIAELRFEEALTLLEGVVSAVESGSLPLDQAIGSYERGTQLVQHCAACYLVQKRSCAYLTKAHSRVPANTLTLTFFTASAAAMSRANRGAIAWCSRHVRSF
jgi:exodeoxyribonuclease VII small subunit